MQKVNDPKEIARENKGGKYISAIKNTIIKYLYEYNAWMSSRRCKYWIKKCRILIDHALRKLALKHLRTTR